MRILVVDDDAGIRDALTTVLHLAWDNSTVIVARDGDEGLRAFRDHTPDVVLLDVAMPGKSGFDVLRHIRRVSDVPVLMLTGRGDEIDQVRGLELGADAYLNKPFTYGVLIARIKAALRRADLPSPAPTVPTFIAGDLTINDQSHQVTSAGTPVKLTPVEYRLLDQLARNAGRVMPHQTLLDRVWGVDYGATTDDLKVFICRLRAKLERPSGARYIETERGLGYRFVRPSTLASNVGRRHQSFVGRATGESYARDCEPIVSVA